MNNSTTPAVARLNPFLQVLAFLRAPQLFFSVLRVGSKMILKD